MKFPKGNEETLHLTIAHRMGWPWPAEGAPEEVAEGLGGMGATYIPDLMPCAEKILWAVIDTCTRPRSQMLS